MASTRNLNMRDDYIIQQKRLELKREYDINPYGRPTQELLPTQMMNYGSMSRDGLSTNAVDIETELFGVGSTNLVVEKSTVRPGLVKHGDIDFCTQSQMVMDEKHTQLTGQRPLMR